MYTKLTMISNKKLGDIILSHFIRNNLRKYTKQKIIYIEGIITKNKLIGTLINDKYYYYISDQIIDSTDNDLNEEQGDHPIDSETPNNPDGEANNESDILITGIYKYIGHTKNEGEFEFNKHDFVYIILSINQLIYSYKSYPKIIDSGMLYNCEDLSIIYYSDLFPGHLILDDNPSLVYIPITSDYNFLHNHS